MGGSLFCGVVDSRAKGMMNALLFRVAILGFAGFLFALFQL